MHATHDGERIRRQLWSSICVNLIDGENGFADIFGRQRMTVMLDAFPTSGGHGLLSIWIYLLANLYVSYILENRQNLSVLFRGKWSLILDNPFSLIVFIEYFRRTFVSSETITRISNLLNVICNIMFFEWYRYN